MMINYKILKMCLEHTNMCVYMCMSLCVHTCELVRTVYVSMKTIMAAADSHGGVMLSSLPPFGGLGTG